MSAFVQINKLWFKYCFDLKYDNDYNINGNKIQADLKPNNLPKIFKHQNPINFFLFYLWCFKALLYVYNSFFFSF